MKFRLSSTLSVTFSPPLHAQLLRYTQAKDMPRSKTVRRAVYELLESSALNKMDKLRPILPALALQPKRTETVAWTMPENKPAHRQLLDEVCHIRNISVTTFTRRAVYLYTIDYVSTDKEEAAEALADGWA